MNLLDKNCHFVQVFLDNKMNTKTAVFSKVPTQTDQIFWNRKQHWNMIHTNWSTCNGQLHNMMLMLHVTRFTFLFAEQRSRDLCSNQHVCTTISIVSVSCLKYRWRQQVGSGEEKQNNRSLCPIFHKSQPSLSNVLSWTQFGNAIKQVNPT